MVSETDLSPTRVQKGLMIVDPKIRFIVSVPDGRPDEASPMQGFAPSLCRNSRFLRFIYRMPADIFELTPDYHPYRIVRRISGQAPVEWYGQTPGAIKAMPLPIEAAFTSIFLDPSECLADYAAWRATCPGPVTLIASGGELDPATLDFERFHTRLRAVCAELRALGMAENIDGIEAAVAAWEPVPERKFMHPIGGHATIFPNVAALETCGFRRIAPKALSRFAEGEAGHVEQIAQTSHALFDERDANPSTVANRIYPRSPDLNLYLPSTYDLSGIQWKEATDPALKRRLRDGLRAIERQTGYSYEMASDAQRAALLGRSDAELSVGEKAVGNPVMMVRQQELWLGTEAVACLAASEVGAVVRLPNRMNRTRGAVRQFAQHYRADRPQVSKRADRFRTVQRAIDEAFPAEFRELLDRSRDGVRIIADAHIEWLDVRGIPLGIRYDVARIPVTPGNAFIAGLTPQPTIQALPADFAEVLVVSGLPEQDAIAKPFKVAFEAFGRNWQDTLKLRFVRVKTRREFVDAINGFSGMIMLFDGHGTHRPDKPGVLWLHDEAVDVWGLRDDIIRAPPIVILSACDTHAADRNHATVANGFLSLGSRSVLGSVFPLHAVDAAIFAARLLYRVAAYLPAAVNLMGRSITWLELVSGMLRRQLVTDILRHLVKRGDVAEPEELSLMRHLTDLMETKEDPFSEVRAALIEHGVEEALLDRETRKAIAASSTISYLHLGRPETILINTEKTLERIRDMVDVEDRGGADGGIA